MGLRDLVDTLWFNACLVRKLTPSIDGVPDGFNHLLCAPGLDASGVRKAEQIIVGKVIPFPGQAHLVFAGPFAARIPCVGDIECG